MSAAPTLVAGVDSSTQSCKVVIRDAETGALLRSGRAPHPDGTEVDPEAWWAALGAAIADAGGFDDVAAVSIAGQQHGLVVLDDDGRVVRPALLWNDTRSADAARDLLAEFGADDLVARTGLVPVASFTATKLRWMRDHEPELVARVAAVALPHDWLSWRLRGYGPLGTSALGPDLDALATDASDASGTAYWSPRSGEYDAEVFERALGRPLRIAGEPDDGGRRVIVPRVVAPVATMGRLARDVEVSEGAIVRQDTAVGAGAGDNAAAALGLGVGPGDVVVSIGTSGTVFASTADVVADPSGTVAGFSDAAGARLPIVTTLNAARVLDVVGAFLGVDHVELGRLASTVPAGSDGLVLVPYFVGERTPNLPEATAWLHGMTPRTMRREHLARAAIEGMLCALADGVDALRSTGVAVDRIVLIGGAAQNDSVRAVAATVFDVPTAIPAPGEYVALGAAAQAAWALSGERPSWPVSSATTQADLVPEVRRAYAAARGQGAGTSST